MSCRQIRIPGPETCGRARSYRRVPVPRGRHAPPDQGVTGFLGSKLPPGTKGRELPGPAPMEMDALDPPPLGRAQTVQRSVYFISKVLHEAKTRYLEVHKLFYAVLIAK
jgi:hypothetical protein